MVGLSVGYELALVRTGGSPEQLVLRRSPVVAWPRHLAIGVVVADFRRPQLIE